MSPSHPFRSLPAALVLVVAVVAALAPVVRADTTDPHAPGFLGRFPSDSGVVDVRTFGAIPDDGQPDDAALRAAFADTDLDASPADDPFRRLAPRTVYLPAGTYDVSTPVVVPSSTIRIVGAGADATSIRLAPRSAAFADATKPVAVLQTGNYTDAPGGDRCKGKPNCGFANYVEDLGVAVGRDNPGAIGIRYDVANVGAVRRVLITAADGSGRTGLAFGPGAGPGRVSDVTVRGFEVGVRLDRAPVNQITISNLRIQHPRKVGVFDDGTNVVLDHLVCVAPVAVRTRRDTAVVTMVDSRLVSSGAGPAIRSAQPATLYVRATRTEGFTALANVDGRVVVRVRRSGARVREWSTAPLATAGPGGSARKAANGWAGTAPRPLGTMNLAVPTAEPLADPIDPIQWVNAAKLVQPGDGGDFSLAVQRAIDLQPAVVYVPWSGPATPTYELRTPVVLHGRVQHLDLGGAELRGTTADARIEVGAVDQPVLVDDGATNLSIVADSAHAVLIRDLGVYGHGLLTVRAGSTGPLLLDDLGSHTSVAVERGARAYAWSIDRTGTRWTNDGGVLRCLGCSNETDLSPVVTTGGGRTELLGTDYDKLFTDGSRPVGAGSGPFVGQALFQVSGAGSRVSFTLTGSLRTGVDWGALLTDRTATAKPLSLRAHDATRSGTVAVLPVYTTPG